MLNLIMAVAIALTSLWVVWPRIRTRFNDVDDAVAYIHRKLPRKGPAEVPVRVWQSHPLTEHQIKEVAELAGYRFVKAGGDGGSGSHCLIFVPRGAADV